MKRTSARESLRLGGVSLSPSLLQSSPVLLDYSTEDQNLQVISDRVGGIKSNPG